MDEEKINTIYTAEDIQNYLLQKLNAAQMHAMEKAALDDPFLAEAMEGFSTMKEADLDTHLVSLRQKFLTKQHTRTTIIPPAKRFTMWKAAAAILLICGSVTITYLFTKNKSTSDIIIAKLDTKQDTPTPTLAETLQADSATDLALSPKADNTVNRIEEKTASPVPTIAPSADSLFVYRPGSSQNNKLNDVAGGGYVDDVQKSRKELSATNNAESLTLNNAETQQVSSEAEQDQVTGYATARKKNDVPLNRFSARVVTPDNEPVPFANISIPKDNKTTYTDAGGNFQVVSPDSLVNVRIRSFGYVARNYTLKNNAVPPAIVLNKDNVTLNETSANRDKVPSPRSKQFTIARPDLLMDAEPADGWDKYHLYVTNNLAASNKIIQQNIHGHVQVSFEVALNGTITNLKVEKGLCGDCDAEAVRLVKEGPKWKVKDGKSTRAKLTVDF